MRVLILGAVFLLGACSAPSNSPTGESTTSTSASEPPAGSIQISVTQLDQLDEYGCKVYMTAKNTNTDGERTPFIEIDTEAVSADGTVLSTGKTGISNVLPGRTVNREFLLNDVQCTEIDHFRGLSGESDSLAPSPDTKVRIEV